MSAPLIEQIPLISESKKIIKINKGFSADEKYLIHMPEGRNELFLRLFNLEQLESKKIEYSILEKMQDYDVRCSKLDKVYTFMDDHDYFNRLQPK